MACFHPLRAWKTQTGEISLTKEEAKHILQLRLPCGGCLGCRMAQAHAWALRCQLELQNHRSAVFTTLTYNDENKPITLQKRHLQLWLKRLRHYADTHVRFFACGEYGETTNRPHYHAILYGLNVQHRKLVELAWRTGKGQPLGHIRTEEITPARIAYTAGYTSKKIGYKKGMVEQVDPETGEVYQWQPPFIQMSRQPGIGGKAREWVQSWRLYAIQNGHKMPVPRFLHNAWKAQATNEQLEELLIEKSKLALNRDTTKERLEAAEKIAEARQALNAGKRTY